jgi:hypothetical protein
MRPLFFALILSCGIVAVDAQNRSFRWADEACSYIATYDGTKHTLIELNNTLKLSRPGSYRLETNTTVWKFADMARLDVPALDREYKQKQAELTNLKIVNVPYWREFRRKKLVELEKVYGLERATMLGYKDRKALLGCTDAPECTTRFAEPLIAGGERLLTVWREVNEDSRKKNADPDRLRRIFDQQFRSPEQMNYALLEVMAFGWGNCANETIPYIEYDGTPQTEFEKLFVSVKRRCDEP